MTPRAKAQAYLDAHAERVLLAPDDTDAFTIADYVLALPDGNGGPSLLAVAAAARSSHRRAWAASRPAPRLPRPSSSSLAAAALSTARAQGEATPALARGCATP